MMESAQRARDRRATWLVGSVGLVVGLAAVLWTLLGGAYKGYEGESVDLVIPRGAPPIRVAEILDETGVIRSSLLFRLHTKISGGSSRLKAGEYRFTGRQTPGQVLRRILAGEVVLHKLTLPEGLSGTEILQRIADAGFASRADLDAAFTDPGPVEDLDPEAGNLEGYLFPDTYHLARPIPARQILRSMVDRFRQEMSAGMRARAGELGMTLREVVTMASLIEKETSLPEERGRVSAVFHNRLRRRMALQCDPTVIYALAVDGRYRGSLSRTDLRYDSPYNTYVYRGLPPGPIAAPGRAALEAAVNPDEVPDLYFVADGNGGHTFSRTLAEHLKAVSRYRRLTRSGA